MPEPFESTPEFANFREKMRQLIAVPKSEIDRRLREDKKQKLAKARQEERRKASISVR
jgi:hypothetical protein